MNFSGIETISKFNLRALNFVYDHILNISQSKSSNLQKENIDLKKNYFENLRKLDQEKNYTDNLIKKNFREKSLNFIEIREILQKMSENSKQDFYYQILFQKVSDFLFNNKITQFGAVEDKYNYKDYEISPKQEEYDDAKNLDYSKLIVIKVIKIGYKLNEEILKKAEVIVGVR